MAVNRTKVLEAAQKFLAKNQYDKAIAEYQKLVAEDPRDVRTLLKIGDLHTRRSKPKDAIEVYLKVADLYAKQGFFLKAVAVYKQILKLEPTHLESSLRLAKMYEELGLTNDALTTYESVADAYMEQSAINKALETMERMVELDGSNIAVRIKYAEALSRASRPKDAATAFAAGARLLKEQGRMDDYLRVVERQLYHDPENVSIARELSSLYLERTDPKRALTKLQVCFKADPRDVQTLEMLAEAFRQLGQLPKTISVLKEIARLHGELGAHEARRRTLARVLELDPNDAEAKVAIASIPQASAAQVPQARPSQAEAAPAAEPAEPEEDAEELDDVELEVEESDSDDDVEFVDSDDEEEVLLIDEDVEPSADADLLRPEDLLEQADLLEADERYEEAERLVQSILERNANHEEAHERLKDLYLATDRRVDAVRELLWLSKALAEKNPERAIQHARTALDLAPHAAATQEQLRALGVDPNASPSAPAPRPDLDDELAAFLDGTDAPQAGRAASTKPPPLGRTSSAPPAVGFSSAPPAAGFSSAPPAAGFSSAPPRAAGVDRATVPDADEASAAGGSVLDIELDPSEFDAPPPVRVAPFDPALLALLEREHSPEDFMSEVAAAALPAHASVAPLASEGLEAADDLVDPLLDAPISPDEFDAPPPVRPSVELDERALELLDQPIAADDFGLSDDRFYDSGLVEVEGSPSNRPTNTFDDDLFDTRQPPRMDSGEAIVRALERSPDEDSGFTEIDSRLTLPPELQTIRPGPDAEDEPADDNLITAPPAALEAQPEGEPAFANLAFENVESAEENLLPGSAPTVPGAPLPEMLAAEQAHEATEAAAELALEDEAPADELLEIEPESEAEPVFEPEPEPVAPTQVDEELPAVAADSLAPAEATPEAVQEAAPEPEPEPVAPAAAATPAVSEAVQAEIEEVLDEADFFASQGMMDEALELIQEAILIYPKSDALRARLLQYEAEADAQEAAAEAQPADIPDDSFDIAEQLANELAEVSPESGDEMVDVESVFAQFKKGVAAQIAPEDSDTHFDLGIAYKEMGLTDDAISEFELAAKNVKRACTSLTMIGMCYLEKGNADKAISYFEQALEAPSKSPLEDMALHYELGNAHEQLGKLDLALSEFEKVAAQDRTFRGVLNRLDSLKKRGAVA